MLWCIYFPSTFGSAQRRFKISRFSSMSLPRLSNGTPTASNSRLYQPEAMPMMRRPSERWSMLESCLASVTGLRRGRTRTPLPIFHGFVVEAHPGEFGKHAEHPACRQAALGARLASAEEAGACDEVDLLHKTP